MPTTPNTTNAAREAGQPMSPRDVFPEAYAQIDANRERLISEGKMEGPVNRPELRHHLPAPSSYPTPRLTLPPKTVFSDTRIRTV